MTDPLNNVGTVMVDKEDFRRLEAKVDRLIDGFATLAVVEERQSTNNQRVMDLEKEYATLKASHEALGRMVDKWINRGIGVWSLAVVLFAILQYLHK